MNSGSTATELDGGSRQDAGRPESRLGDTSLVMSTGLATVAAANLLARSGQHWAGPVFWVGLLLIVAPPAVRCFGRSAGPTERVGLLMALAIALYLVKLLHSPGQLSFRDEFTHLRTLQDMLSSGDVLNRNPILPPSARYPGLQIATSCVVSVTGVSHFAAAATVIGLARVLLTLSLFSLLKSASGSDRIASLAVLLYFVHPNFLFWTAQYAYESLALPLALFAWVVVTMRASSVGHVAGRRLLLGAALLAVIVTHHSTSFWLCVMLATWSAISYGMTRRHKSPVQNVGPWPAVAAAALTSAWLLTVGHPTFRYLEPYVSSTVTELQAILGRGADTRPLFVSAGRKAPIAERVVGVAAVGTILLALPIGLILAWQSARRNALAVVLMALAATYPIGLALRFTGAGQEASNRSSEFVFVGLALALAFAADRLLAHLPGRIGSVALTSLYTFVFAGGFIVGWAFYARLPGDHLVSAGGRSVGPPSMAAAEWVKDYLPERPRIVSDRMGGAQLGSIGRAYPVSSFDGVSTWPVFFRPSSDDEVLGVLGDGDIQYVVIDRRMASDLPYDGVYIERGEPVGTRISREALLKFDSESDLYDRIYDNGSIVIYRVLQ